MLQRKRARHPSCKKSVTTVIAAARLGKRGTSRPGTIAAAK
jgi:hypothetical protein